YGDLRDMVKIYQRADNAKLEYDYDAGGNRTTKRTIVGNCEETTYEYYENSNRLKKATNNLTGETFYYVYDENGNLVEKGNNFTENPNGTVSFIKDGYKEYWSYEYTIKNRLKAVYLNEELQAEFVYDTDGMRIRSDVKDESVTHYVFNQAGKVLLEVYDPVLDEIQAENNQTEVSYIYAYGRQIAKVEGIIGNSEEIVYYHHDNLGSTRLITDKDGFVIWEQDYMPFGEDLYKPGTSVFEYEEEIEYKFTGQRHVKGIGLYYYGARYYDPEIGRFISEDTYCGELDKMQSQNIYIYTINNPLKYIDPTGNYWVKDMWHWDIWFYQQFSINDTEKDAIQDLLREPSFKKRYTFNGELYRYKLGPTKRRQVLLQGINSWNPFGGSTINYIIERELFGIADGNSLTSEEDAKISGFLALTGQFAQTGKLANIIKGLDITNNSIGSIKTMNQLVSEYGVPNIDKVVFKLMKEARIPECGNEKQEINARMKFMYEFVLSSPEYFLMDFDFDSEHKNMTYYEYESKLPVMILKNYKPYIIDALQKTFWGYWEEGENRNKYYVNGYYQEFIDNEYRVE
ncbi:MAG: RHS repeat-associated core domain-containing protein, partial [Halanaerobiales bacterium]|nr:RHS repeat-associated core domain-containing protein [Halanaerobiales bacterium]